MAGSVVPPIRIRVEEPELNFKGILTDKAFSTVSQAVWDVAF